MQEFPSNSHKSKEAPAAEKRVERVTSSEAVRRRKPLGKQFKGTFFGGDAKTAFEYVIFSVLVPAAKDALADAGAQGIERLIFGDSKSRRHPANRPQGPTGYVQYNRMSGGGPLPPEPRTISKRARSQHDFDEIVLTSRTEAELVIDQLYDILGRYETVSVADLYALVGLESAHTDNKWGWDDLHGAGVTKVRAGYLLDLPEPEPLG